MSGPKVSCLLPTKDRFELLVRSVACFCRQSYPHKELVVASEGSNDYKRRIDELLAALGRDDIRTVYVDGAGWNLGKMRNLALQAAAGEVFCQWDDDDWNHPRRLERQLHTLLAQQAAACFLTEQMHYLGDTNELFWVTWDLQKRGGIDQQVIPGTMMCRRSAAGRYPETGPEARRSEDVAFLRHLLAAGPIAKHGGEPFLYVYTYHGRNLFPASHHQSILRESCLAQPADFLRARRLRLCQELDQYEWHRGDIRVCGTDGLAFVFKPTRVVGDGVMNGTRGGRRRTESTGVTPGVGLEDSTHPTSLEGSNHPTPLCCAVSMGTAGPARLSRPLRLFGITMVRNEADILEAFLRSSLQLLDGMAVVDHNSCDASRALLARLQAEGLPLVLATDLRPEYPQSEAMTALMRSVSGAFDPDWIVPLDADEFLVPGVRSTLEKALRTLAEQQPGVHGLIPWTGYVATAADPADQRDVLRRITHCRAREVRPFHKVVIPRSLHRDPATVIAPGNHELKHTDGQSLRGTALPGLHLAHFPVRSAAQIVSKALVGWLAHRSDPAREESEAQQQREMFERFRKGMTLADTEVTALGVTYSGCGVAPIRSAPLADIPYCRLRYQDLMDIQVAGRLATMAEQLAARVASLLKGGEITPTTAATAAACRHLCERFQPASVLEVGDGKAACLFQEWGIKRIQVIGPEQLTSLEPGATFDLVLATSLPGRATAPPADVVDALSRHAARVVVFDPGPDGAANLTRSVRATTVAAWLRFWRGRGWRALSFDSLALRALAAGGQFLVLTRADLAWPEPVGFTGDWTRAEGP